MSFNSGMTDAGSTAHLLAEAASGRTGAVERLLTEHRDYVRQIIALRIDPALKARIDASDIVQDTLAAASRRLDGFLRGRPTTFRLWLRSQAIERLIDARRKHVSQKRDARREVYVSDASSLATLGGLAAASPSEHVMRRELIAQVQSALASLNEMDREILLMRHGEQLSVAEAAALLNISPDAASKRYGRAALRLISELRRRGVTGSP